MRVVDRWVGAVAVVCLVVSTGMICANVFYRYVVLDWFRGWAKDADWVAPVYRVLNDLFGAVSVTADEVPGYLLVWIAFLGAYLAMRREGHIGFDVLIDRLAPQWRRGVRAAIDISIVAFLALLLWQSIRMIRVDGATEIETAEIAQGWFMAVLPISATLLIVAVAAKNFRRHRGPDTAD